LDEIIDFASFLDCSWILEPGSQLGAWLGGGEPHSGILLG